MIAIKTLFSHLSLRFQFLLLVLSKADWYVVHLSVLYKAACFWYVWKEIFVPET